MADTAAALAAAIKDSVSAAVTRTARGTVVAVGTDGTVTFIVGGLTTPRKGIWVGNQPQVGEVITYLDEGRGFPLVFGATGVRDLYVPATKALIVGNTRVDNTGVTTTGNYIDGSGNLRASINALLPTAWTTVGAFQNGWGNYFGGYHAAAYRKVGDVVELRGLVQGGTVSGSGTGTIFTLPSGFRPAFAELFPTIAGNAIGRINVFSSGAVGCEVGTNTFVSLSGIQVSTA